MRVTEKDLDALNQRFAAATPREVLTFAHETFGTRVAILSSMQRSGTILCHIADRAGLAFDVVFVDTGVLHGETLRTRDELARTHRHLTVVTLEPAKSFAAQTAEEGVLYLTREGQERCCDLRKTAPLHSVRGKYDALISALRSDEGGDGHIDALAHKYLGVETYPYRNAADTRLICYVEPQKVLAQG